MKVGKVIYMEREEFNLLEETLRMLDHMTDDLDRLEKQGLIERVADIKDKRAVKTLKLSDEGSRIYQEACSNCVKHVENIENIFNQKEFETFKKYIDRLKIRLIETCGEVLE